MTLIVGRLEGGMVRMPRVYDITIGEKRFRVLSTTIAEATKKAIGRYLDDKAEPAELALTVTARRTAAVEEVKP